MLMGQIHARFAVRARREVANVACRIHAASTIVVDVVDAGERSARRTTVRDLRDARSDTQSWTSERRVHEISLSAQTGAT